jgi:hypothetical protein
MDETPKRKPSSYNLFMKEWMSKKPADKSPTEWMKQIGKKWRAATSLSEIARQTRSRTSVVSRIKATTKNLEARLKVCEERLKACERVKK